MITETSFQNLPLDVEVYSFQIAGHVQGILKHKNGQVLKILNKDLKGKRELSFYESIYKDDDIDPVNQELRSFIPAFFGTTDIVIKNQVVKFLCIEDICHQFQHPSVFDLKIGVITYDPLATEEKIKYEIDKYPESTILGFRILGMKVYDHTSETYTFLGKSFGKKLLASDILCGLGKCFLPSFGDIRCLILSGFIHRLLKLSNWFSRQKMYAFYASSIIFVYESISGWNEWIKNNNMHFVNAEHCEMGDLQGTVTLHSKDCHLIFNLNRNEEIKNACEDCFLNKDICAALQNNCSLYRISMIDFCHVFSSTDIDSNYIFGLDNIIKYMKALSISFNRENSI